MKLDPNGRKRLDAMKKALAAGLPLAGLLAAAACSKEPEGKTSTQSQRNWIYRGEPEAAAELDSPVDSDEVMGDLWGPGPTEESLDIDRAIGSVEELTIATDVATLGVLLPPDALQSPEGGGEAEGQSDDDVTVRIVDLPPIGEGQP